MAEVLKLVGHWLLGIGGVLLCLLIVLMKKNEQGNFENIIQKAWVRIYQLQLGAVSRETAFMRVVAEITSKGLAYLFGKSLFTLRAALVSSCFSIASVTLTTFTSGIFDNDPEEKKLIYFVLGVALLVLGAVRHSLRQSRLIYIWGGLCTFGIIYCIVLASHAIGFNGVPLSWPLVALSLFVAICFDFMFIIFTRNILSLSARSKSLFRISIMLVANLCLGIALLAIPLGITVLCANSSKLHDSFVGQIAFACILIYISNLLDALVSSVFIFVAVAMLIHRLVWPFIERPICLINENKIFSEQKKLVFFTGLACICFAWPPVGEKVKTFVESVVK